MKINKSKTKFDFSSKIYYLFWKKWIRKEDELVLLLYYSYTSKASDKFDTKDNKKK